ncbi:unnamed protein product [Chrysoparadoxa australica]
MHSSEGDEASVGTHENGEEGKRFRAKTFLERQVEKLGVEDEEKAQEKVSSQLQQKHDRAQSKRELDMLKLQHNMSERHKKIEEARAAMLEAEALASEKLLQKHEEKVATARHRRRRGLETIKQARAEHHQVVQRKRSESLDQAPMQEAEALLLQKLERATMNRHRIQETQRRRSAARYESAKSRYTAQVAISRDVQMARQHRYDEVQNAARNRINAMKYNQRQKHERVRVRKARLYAARVIQEWWRCMKEGSNFKAAVTGIVVMTPVTSPEGTPISSPGTRSPALSPCMGTTGSTAGSSTRAGKGFPLYPGNKDAAFASEDWAAATIQSFFKAHLHQLKVCNAVVLAAPALENLCESIMHMSRSTYEEAMAQMGEKGLISDAEVTLRALRMGKEMRHVPQSVRGSRAFLSCLLINFYPKTSLSDEGALSGITEEEAEADARLELERDRLVLAAGKALSAFIMLKDVVCQVQTSKETGAEKFMKVKKASLLATYARVQFCRQFADWRRLDAERLADEMTAACVDIMLMQLRAERDLHDAAVRYGLDEEPEQPDMEDTMGLSHFSTGYNQIKDGTRRQLSKMLQALSQLVGRTEGQRRMDEATRTAFARLRADTMDDEELLKHFESEDARKRIKSEDVPEEEEEVGVSRPLSASDLLNNEWLVHEVMLSAEPIQISHEEATENGLLNTTSVISSQEAFWVVSGKQLEAGDYTPLLALIFELRNKIIGLTPRRKDLAAETSEALDVELLDQMMQHGAMDLDTFFRMIAFAGERVLELEAPVRNEDTKAKLAEWEHNLHEIHNGTRQFNIEVVKDCFDYLYQKTDEIHVDILNAHLQFVTPFLKQHGVEYERDRFTEKLDTGDASLEQTHLWLHKCIAKIRASPREGNNAELLEGLEQKTGDAYLSLLRRAMIDSLLGNIVGAQQPQGEAPKGNETKQSKQGGKGGNETAHVPETLAMDQFRLVVIAAGVEQVGYTAALIAFVKQVLGSLRLGLKPDDEEEIRRSLMILFESDDVASADIIAQVVEMSRRIAIAGGKAWSAREASTLTSRVDNILTTGNCPVYQLYLKRVLGVVKGCLLHSQLDESAFTEACAKASLVPFREYLLERVVHPFITVQRHNEAVFTPYYNEVIGLAMQTSDEKEIAAHKAALDVD